MFSELERKLIEIKDQIGPMNISRDDRFDRFDFLERHQGHVEEIASEISRIDYFDFLRYSRIVLPSMSMAVDANFFASIIVYHIQDGQDPISIIRDFNDFISLKSVALETHFAIQGFQVKHRINISENSFIDRPENIHPSIYREHIFSIGRRNNIEYNNSDLTSLMMSALVIRHSAKIIFGGDEPDVSFDIKAVDAEIHRVESAVILADTAPVSLGWSYTICRHPFMTYQNIGGGYSKKHQLNPVGFHESNLDESYVREVYQHSLRLESNKSLFEIFSRAIRRLNRSRMHWDLVDRCIDLGVAGEILLLHDASVELSSKFAFRGAAFLGGEILNKKENFRTLKKFYDARSKSVHTGHLKNVTRSDVDVFDKMIVDVARKVLQDRRLPSDDDVLGS